MSASEKPSISRPPRVLFVSDDSSSPEIAASLLRDVAGDHVAVATASTQYGHPGGRSDEMLVAMGLNPATEKLSAGTLHTADRVIVLGTDIDVARIPGPSYEEWDLAHEDLIVRVEALSEALTKAMADKPKLAVPNWLPKLRETVRGSVKTLVARSSRIRHPVRDASHPGR